MSKFQITKNQSFDIQITKRTVFKSDLQSPVELCMVKIGWN